MTHIDPVAFKKRSRSTQATWRLSAFWVGVAFATLILAPAEVLAQTYELVADLNGTGAVQPWGGVIRAADGNLYGTTTQSVTPPWGCGSVYSVTPDGTVTVLHEFTKIDGCFPVGELVEGPDGHLYGTTSEGGPTTVPLTGGRGTGTVFRITTAGQFTLLHEFAYDEARGIAPEGAYPFAGLALGTDGNFYGTTNFGGDPGPCGTIFRVTPDGALTVLHAFGATGGGGCFPNSGLNLGADGNFYGVALASAGAQHAGVVFTITPGGDYSLLGSLPADTTCNCAPIGGTPLGEPVRDGDGNLYGTAAGGGPPNGGNEFGTVWKLSPGGEFTLLHAFTGPDGGLSSSGLTMGSDGNLYGVTYGVNGFGTVFRITLAGEFTNLYSFDQSVGPDGRLFETSPGVFVGTTQTGGAGGAGLVFKLTLASPTTTSLGASPTSSVFAQQVTLTATVSAASGTPDGSVEFFDGVTSLGTAQLNGGVATLSTTALAVGAHNIGASYAGETAFLPSAASPVAFVVAAASTTTTISSSTNPVNRRQVARLTATVAAVAPAGGIASGQVVFKEGKKTVGTAALVSGQASLNVTYAAAGTRSIVATYAGDGNLLGSTSQTYLLVVVR